MVKVGDGFDAAEIIFQRDVFVGRVRVFVRQAEAEQDAGHFEGVVHLRDERDRAALANEDGAFAKSFFERALGDLKNGAWNGATHGLPVLSTSNLQLTVFGRSLRICFSTSFAILCGS